MKKLIFIFAIIFGLTIVMGCDFEVEKSASVKTAETANNAMESAITATPIPIVTHFLERKTITKWVETWDQPSLPCYVYLYSYGVCIGYYISNGKPASTQSYLIPEESYQRVRSAEGYSSTLMTQAPDLDGTYGTNNPGIRFFTASGVAVEWAGAGATYLYSNAPIKTLNVPLLGD